MTQLKMALMIAAAALVGLIAHDALAGECCCHCGCNDGARKVCRLVPDKRKIEKTVFGCECSEVCIPGKACRGCLNCDEKCGESKGGCDSCNHAPYAMLKWFDWQPGCANVKTVKKLIKYTASKEVCGWKWKIEEVCDGCCPASNCVQAQDGTPVEKAPPGVSADQVPLPPVPIAPSAYLPSARE